MAARGHQYEFDPMLQAAEQIQARWSWERGLNTGVYTPHEFAQDSFTKKETSSQSVLKMVLGEWVELVTELVKDQSDMPTRLLEVADIGGFLLHYVGFHSQVHSETGTTFSLEEAKQVEQRFAQGILASPVYPLKEKQWVGKQRKQLHQDLFQMGVHIVAMHLEVHGHHPNGSPIAEVKMRQVHESVGKALQKIQAAAQKGDVSKALSQAIIDEMVSYIDRLPHVVQKAAPWEKVGEVADELSFFAQSHLGFPNLLEQTGSLYIDTEVDHPQTGQRVAVRGKNSRNYPPGHEYAKVRAIRNQFPASIIPPDFRMGEESVDQYFARTGQVPDENWARKLVQAEVRDFRNGSVREQIVLR